MFGLGFTHLILLFLIGLIFIGPEELPQVARTIGRFLNELKRGGDSFKDEFKKSIDPLEDRKNIAPSSVAENSAPKATDPDTEAKLPKDPPG